MQELEKGVVLSFLFDQIQKLRHYKNSNFYQTNNYFLVNHPEILKVYKQIAGPLPELLKKNFQRPTSFINQLDKNKKKRILLLLMKHIYFFQNLLTIIISIMIIN